MLPLENLKSTPSIAAVTLQYPAKRACTAKLGLEVSTWLTLPIKCFTKVVFDGENKNTSPDIELSLSLSLPWFIGW